jgi:hypothetical protein
MANQKFEKHVIIMMMVTLELVLGGDDYRVLYYFSLPKKIDFYLVESIFNVIEFFFIFFLFGVFFLFSEVI